MCSILGYCSTGVSEETVAQMLSRTISRGPDDTRLIKVKGGYLGFNRLSIMGLTEEGMQPFERNGRWCICNGEIYGFRDIKKDLEAKGYEFRSDSDCELLLPMYELYGTKMFAMLDAEFALVIYDGINDTWIAARDPIGIRPLYYGYDNDDQIVFASEPKNLVGVCGRIYPFPPGYYYKDGHFMYYRDISEADSYCYDDLDTISVNIHDKLLRGIEKRLDSDTPVGFLLSGGLDSSLVCGAAAKLLDRPIETFAIGMDIDAIDLKYAREVADYIHSNHHEVIITRDDVINALDPVIEALGTYDITTVRASVGMYLLCRWIHEHTDIKVLLTGEISDELFGYKYTDFAPNAEEFQKEARKRIHEIHMYDVLRADRCISVNSLEARVPFGDLKFVRYAMSIDPELKMNRPGVAATSSMLPTTVPGDAGNCQSLRDCHPHMGKYLIRKAFADDHILPDEILWRQKAAFSDAVGHSMVSDLKALAERTYTDAEFAEKASKYDYCRPFTKESLMYRELFEQYYPGQAKMIADFWMPNRTWPGCDVDDPSARVLSNYGASGA